jgi:hypothetical protein
VKSAIPSRGCVIDRAMFIWVYKYRYWDPDLNALETSREFFTLEAIRTGLGMAIIESGTKVSLEQVDDHGRLRSSTNAGIRPYASTRPSPGRSS